MELKECFANNLKARFVISGKSLNEFADELAISRSSLQDILKGCCNPRMDTIQHIANQLNIDPLSLFNIDTNSDNTGKFTVKYCPVHSFVSHTLLMLPEPKRAEIRDLFYRIIAILASIDLDMITWIERAESLHKASDKANEDDKHEE